eukprot:881526_1
MEKTRLIHVAESETELDDGQAIDLSTSLRYKLPRGGLLILASAFVLGVLAVWTLGQQHSKQAMDTVDGSGIIEKQEAKVTVFISSVTGDLRVKKHQQKIQMILTGKNI